MSELPLGCATDLAAELGIVRCGEAARYQTVGTIAPSVDVGWPLISWVSRARGHETRAAIIG